METVVFEDGHKYYRGNICLRKKTKDFYLVEDNPGLLIMRCLDVITPDDDGSIKSEIPGKGKMNAQISSVLFNLLSGRYTDKIGSTPIKTHYISRSVTDESECLVHRMAQAIPLEVIIRNFAYGSYVARTGTPEGTPFDSPLCELTLKDDARHDPLISRTEVEASGIATRLELDYMKDVALAVNQIMRSFFREIGIELIDFKLVFGRQGDVVGDYTNIRLIGELSPDVCRLRDIKTGKSLDKDIYRHELTGLTEAYMAVLQRMTDADKELRMARRNAAMPSYSSPQ